VPDACDWCISAGKGGIYFFRTWAVYLIRNRPPISDRMAKSRRLQYGKDEKNNIDLTEI
jgi:hypothetical protein